MSVCASGFSRPKSTTAAAVVVDTAYIQSILPAGLSWAFPYLPYMQGLVIGDVGAFCAVDPPLTWTVPTADQILAFITGIGTTAAGGWLSEYNAVNNFLQAVTRSYLWYGLCECSAGAAPTPPTPPTAPADLPAINPAGPTSLPAASSCANYSRAQFGGFNPAVTSTINAIWPTTWTSAVPTHDTVPTGASSYRLTITQVSAGIHHGFLQQVVTMIDVAGNVIAEFPSVTTTGSTSVFTGNVPQAATGFWISGYGQYPGVTDTMDFHLEFFCNVSGPGGFGASECCPPDPIARGLLAQIQQMLTLIQRQEVPFAYIKGTPLTALFDSGSEAIEGLVGLLVDLTTIPAYLGRAAGVPEALFEAGRLVVGTADGYRQSVPIASEHFLWFPPKMGLMTVMGYSLAGGVVATITPLEREP